VAGGHGCGQSYHVPWWEILDVSDWTAFAPEARGRRPKLWVKDRDGNVWLRKEPLSPPPADKPQHTARRTESAIELLALELAKRIGIETSIARPATWSDGRGLVSQRFHQSDEQHHPGGELLSLATESGSSPEARRRRDEGRASASVDRVRARLEELERSYRVPLLAPLSRVLVFDAWIGNGDRHAGNWAIVTGPRGTRFAPMFDPAACLGVELTDDRVDLTLSSDERIRRYVDKCGSGFGGGPADGRTGLPMREVMTLLSAWREWREAIFELTSQVKRVLSDVPGILSEIPDDWLPPSRKHFAARVLERRATLFDGA
jgi:hypothetical protein